MADPFVDGFLKGYATRTSPAEQEQFTKEFVTAAELQLPPNQLYPILLEINRHIGKDTTSSLSTSQAPNINPIPVDEVKANFQRLKDDAPWTRKVVAKLGGAADALQRNAEFGASNALNTILNAIPGEQQLEKTLDENFNIVINELAADHQINSTLDSIKLKQNALGEAYRRTKMTGGMKGAMELIFDPLNLIGAGLPAKLGKAAPILRPLMIPLNAIDQAPGVIVEKILTAPAKSVQITQSMANTVPFLKPLVGKKFGALELPVIRALREPSVRAKVLNAGNQVRATLEGGFGPKLFSENPADTLEVLSTMKKFPDAADPRSMHGIMSWVLNDTPGKDWEPLYNSLTKLKPREAIDVITTLAVATEERSIRAGGKVLGGEVVESISQRRQNKIVSWFDQVNLDAGYAKAIAGGIDKHLTRFEGMWINKIEPAIIRPWSLAYLYTIGYLPTNMGEDIVIATLGMGTNPFGVNDKIYKITMAGLPRPQFLDDAEAIARGTIDVRSGLYDRKPSRNFFSKAGDVMRKYTTTQTAVWSGAIQRSSLNDVFSSEFLTSIRSRGVTDAEIDNIRTFIKTELPSDLADIRDEIEPIIWSMLTTGDSNSVRQVSDLFTSSQHLIRSQHELLKEIVELPTDARAFVRERLAAGETITADNVTNFRREMRDSVVEHHRWSEDSIRDEAKQMLRALDVRAPESPDEAMSLFRQIHAVGERLSDLPREVNARAKLLGRQAASAAERTAINNESLRIVDDVIGEVRDDYFKMIEKSQPHIEKQLIKIAGPGNSRSVKDSLSSAFTAKREIGENLGKTWTEYRKKRVELFDDTSRVHDRAFWDEVHRVGDEIWESEKVFRARQARIADDHWMTVFTQLRRNLNQSSKTFATDTLHSMWGETSQRLDDFRSDLFRLENLRASVPTSGATALEQKITTTKRIITSEVIARRELESQITHVQGQTARFKQPSVVDEYDENLRILGKELTNARKFGLSAQIEPVQKKIRDLRAERRVAINDLIPRANQQEYRSITTVRDRLAQKTGHTSVELNDLRRVEARIAQIETAAGRGEGVRQGLLMSNVSRSLVGEVAASVHSQMGRIPKNVDEVRIALRTLASTDDEAAQTLARMIEANEAEAEDIVQRVFAGAIAAGDVSAVTDLQMKVLQDLQVYPDTTLTETINELIEGGFVTKVSDLPGGRVQLAPTDTGRAILSASPEVSPDISPLLEGLTKPMKPLTSVIEHEYERVDDFLEKAVRLSDDPPLAPAAEGAVREYTKKIAAHMDDLPNFQSIAKEARVEAATNATSKFNKNFINYDNQSTFDFMMQRLFPFWMYDSRRWPRLARLAAKRPVMTKYFSASMGDWDHGYTDVGGSGFQYSPFRAVASSQLKSAVAKDYPEFHDDWRGKKETVIEDWLGRGGFPTNPLISTAALAVSGRVAEALPPPLAAVMNGFVAAGGDIPEPFSDIAFSSRFMQSKIDRVLTTQMGLSPPEVRQQLQRDDEVGEEAKANFDLARQEAARVVLIEQQTSVLRYNPRIRQDFKHDAASALKEVAGISDEDEKEAKRLGIPLVALFPLSGPQRKALRELIPNYDVFIGESISLRPKAEQEQILRVDEFWERAEEMREDFRVREVELSDEYVSGNTSGPELRRELSKIKSERALGFATLLSQPRFQEVPMTIEQRLEWSTRHGSPAPMVHPVDELRERYHAVDPESKDFIHPFTGETDWGKYFDAREEVINEYSPEIQMVFRQVRQVEMTPAERALEAARPWLNVYQGVRNEVLTSVQQLDPSLPPIYQQYLQLKALAARQENPAQAQQFELAALQILAQNPLLMLSERIVRSLRVNLREQNPEMARVYRLWIQPTNAVPLSLGR